MTASELRKLLYDREDAMRELNARHKDFGEARVKAMGINKILIPVLEPLVRKHGYITEGEYVFFIDRDGDVAFEKATPFYRIEATLLAGEKKAGEGAFSHADRPSPAEPPISEGTE